jgi:lipoate-protein ligase A
MGVSSQRVPSDIGERFAWYAKPLVDTYHALNIPANYRPINDIHVQGKKIGGTGAAQMGSAEVIVGSLMFDFNFELMSQVLKVSSERHLMRTWSNRVLPKRMRW